MRAVSIAVGGALECSVSILQAFYSLGKYFGVIQLLAKFRVKFVWKTATVSIIYSRDISRLPENYVRILHGSFLDVFCHNGYRISLAHKMYCCESYVIVYCAVLFYLHCMRN